MLEVLLDTHNHHIVHDQIGIDQNQDPKVNIHIDQTIPVDQGHRIDHIASTLKDQDPNHAANHIQKIIQSKDHIRVLQIINILQRRHYFVQIVV